MKLLEKKKNVLEDLDDNVRNQLQMLKQDPALRMIYQMLMQQLNDTEGFAFGEPGNTRDVFHKSDCDSAIWTFADLLGYKDELNTLISQAKTKKQQEIKSPSTPSGFPAKPVTGSPRSSLTPTGDSPVKPAVTTPVKPTITATTKPAIATSPSAGTTKTSPSPDTTISATKK